MPLRLASLDGTGKVPTTQIPLNFVLSPDGTTSSVTFGDTSSILATNQGLTNVKTSSRTLVNALSPAALLVRPNNVGSIDLLISADRFDNIPLSMLMPGDEISVVTYPAGSTTTTVYGYDPASSTGIPSMLPTGVLPDSSVVGVVQGSAPLTTVSGTYSTSSNGQIIRGFDFKGPVNVNHAVEFHNCLFERQVTNSANALYVHCDFGYTAIDQGFISQLGSSNANYLNTAPSSGVADVDLGTGIRNAFRFPKAWLYRCNLYGFVDLLNINQTSGSRQLRVVNCFLHSNRTMRVSLQEQAGGISHSDGIQLGVNTAGSNDFLIDSNYFMSWSFDGRANEVCTRDGGPHDFDNTPYTSSGSSTMYNHGFTNSSIIVNLGGVSNVLIQNNVFRGQAAKYLIIGSDATGITVQNNTFYKEFRDWTWPGAGSKNPISGPWTGTGNVWPDGRPISDLTA